MGKHLGFWKASLRHNLSFSLDHPFVTPFWRFDKLATLTLFTADNDSYRPRESVSPCFSSSVCLCCDTIVPGPTLDLKQEMGHCRMKFLDI